jgi:uncharacterized protein with FMN-binding domain
MTQAIKKILLGAALIVGLGGYVQWSSTQNQTASAATTTTENTPVATATPVNDTTSSPSTPTPSQTPVAITQPTTRTRNNDSEEGDGGGDEGSEGQSIASAPVQPTVTKPVVATIIKPTVVKPVVTTPAPTPAPVQTGQYKNGTYTGSVASTNYGDVQVAAVISGGKLVDVTFLSYPSNRGHSAQISTYAMPILKSEAITSQSANVDIVSGATQISGGFQSSLADALAAAHV